MLALRPFQSSSVYTVRTARAAVTATATVAHTHIRRGIHIDTATMRQREHSSAILADMLSSGTINNTSAEKINNFINLLYVNTPNTSSLFRFNYRQRGEYSNIRGICIGTNARKSRATQKNVVIVSGLPLQHPSLIGVSLYAAAMLSRINPKLPNDVSVIPLAHPKDYENRWRLPRGGMRSAVQLEDEDSGWVDHETVNMELKDSCKPLEAFITRKNKYLVNIAVNLTNRNSSMQYIGNSLSKLASTGKFRSFLMDQSPLYIPLPSNVSPTSPTSSTPSTTSTTSSTTTTTTLSSSLIPEQDILLSPLLETPSYVLELKGTQALNDEQVVARGEEVIRMVKELLN